VIVVGSIVPAVAFNICVSPSMSIDTTFEQYNAVVRLVNDRTELLAAIAGG